MTRFKPRPRHDGKTHAYDADGGLARFKHVEGVAQVEQVCQGLQLEAGDHTDQRFECVAHVDKSRHGLSGAGEI